MSVHIHAPKGDYLAQIRGRGCRLWETVGEAHADAKSAMCTAINAMTERHKRARVIFCTEWYDPNVVLEAQKP